MRKQNGFSMVMAIFILVVLSLLGGYMVKLGGVQNATSLYAIQGARAYQAARAGIEWSISTISSGGVCNDVTSASPLSFPDINGFSVSLGCNASATYTEGLSNYIAYHIVVQSTYGAYTDTDFISRKIEVSIVK